jgi:hypothetical protein
MFGMRPTAAAFVLRVHPELAEKYPELAEAAKNLNKNHSTLTERFNSDPAAAADFAKALLDTNKNKTRGLKMLIHSWNHGLKGTWDRFKNEGEDAINNDEYVQKVMKVMKAMNKLPKKEASLEKGSKQGRTPYNPRAETEADPNLGQWIHGADPKMREKSIRVEGNARTRMLHKLYGQTDARKAKDGGVEFLLHRGMSPKEQTSTLNQKDQIVNHPATSSWTPKLDVATQFADYSKTAPVSAWVHQNHIRTSPHQLGFDVDDGSESEHEIIVEPNHNSSLHKALTAGYGGAGSPTSMTGGSVLQAESQEIGPKGLSFITCDNCGKEQVYGKFQVKCREDGCGKAFPLAKLEKFFRSRKD